MKPINLLFFTGFYESIHNAAFEREEEFILEDTGLEYDAIDFTYDHEGYCKGYVSAVNSELGLELEFDALESPKYYNYSTDKIFCKISDSDIAKIATVINTPEFEQYIKDNFTSCSGFHSFYSNELSEWQAKPISEFDEIELGTMLAVYALINDRDIDYYAYEYCSSNGFAAIEYKECKAS